MYFNVSILWLATAMNNFELVKLLVEHGANVNHTTKTNSTPLRCACYHGNVDMTRYLIENGGDINIAKENDETNLKISVWYKRVEMVLYLVNELNCDVNVCDNALRSPLYDAVYRESLELTKFLLAHGARNFRSTHDQMSPLMWVAEKKRIDIMEAIYPYCSLLEQTEAEELLGSAFVCFQHDDRDLEQSFAHFHRALDLRRTHDLQKVLGAISMQIFDYRQEYQTFEQLEEIRSNPERIYIEALLVRERLLGPTCEEYLDSLFYRGATLADNEQYHHAAAFWMYEFAVRQQHTLSIHPDRLRQAVSLFSVMVVKSLLIPIETFVKIITVIIEELEHNKKGIDANMHTLLFLVTIISRVQYCFSMITFFCIISHFFSSS
jgi:Fem-1 family protein b